MGGQELKTSKGADGVGVQVGYENPEVLSIKQEETEGMGSGFLR